jgi:hypothetical protein
MNTFSNIKYPYFKKGQVLKNTDLNRMVEYLDEQNRLSRALVVGSGILFGLGVELPAATSSVFIKISKGLAISSDGYIIEQGEDLNCTHYQSISLTVKNFTSEELSEDNTGTVSYKAFELMGENVVNKNKKPLAQIFSEPNVAGNYCLILWIAIDQKDRPYCIDVCNESGSDLLYQIKPLLIKSDDLKKLVGTTAEIEESVEVPEISILQFGYDEPADKPPVATPSLIKDYKGFRDNYIKIFSKSIADIEIAYSWSFTRLVNLGIIAANEVNPFAGLAENLKKLLSRFDDPILEIEKKPARIEIQYLYLYLLDLKKAFEEFVVSISKLNTLVLPDIGKHPRHVGLSGITVNVNNFSKNEGCRTQFQPSHLNSGGNAMIREAEDLFERMKQLCNASMLALPILDDPEVKYIRVTPGRARKLPLSINSIPFYFKKNIKPYWSKSHTYIDRLFGYRYLDTESQFPAKTPLLSQDDDFNFFRIEGHVGRETQSAFENLKLWIEHYNLPFTVKTVFLNKWLYGHEAYSSPEMIILQEKYTDIRNFFENGKVQPPADVLPNQLSDFVCSRFKDWLSEMEVTNSQIQCYANALNSLRLLYDLELNLMSNLYRFDQFSAKHPGIQPLGGVPKGGTFVLISAYATNGELDKYLMGLENLSQKMEISEEFIDRVLKELKGNLKPIVVGDMALPYICDDAQNIVEPLIIVTPGKFCSSDNNAYEIWTYPSGGKLGSNINGMFDNLNDLPDYITLDFSTGRFLFHPSKVPITGSDTVKSLELVYQINGLDSKVKMDIYKKPDISALQLKNEPIYNENHQIYAQKITFTANVNLPVTDSYWLIDDDRVDNVTGKQPNAMEHIFYYHNKSQYVISFVVKNGICETRTDETINLCDVIFGDDKPKGITLEFSGSPSFSENPEKDEFVTIKPFPLGGVFKMKNAEGTVFDPDIQIEQEGGIFNYTLFNRKQNPLPAGEYVLIYALPVCGSLSASHNFIVQSEPYIILEKDEFFSNDKRRYPIYIHPQNGKLKAEPAIDLYLNGKNEIPFLELSENNIKKLKFENNVASITLKMEGTSATRQLKVIEIPDDFTSETPEFYNEAENPCMPLFKIKFKATEGKVDRYEWQVNDETQDVGAGKNEFVCSVPLQSKLVVKLVTETKVGSQVCINELFHDYSICELLKATAGFVAITEQKDGWKFAIKMAGGSFSVTDEKNGETPFLSMDESDCPKIFKVLAHDLDQESKTPVKYYWNYKFPQCDSPLNGFAFTYPTLKSDSEVMNSRASEVNQKMETLKSDTAFSQTKVYESTQRYILAPGGPDSDKIFFEASEQVLANFKKAKEPKKELYAQLFENLIVSYLDKVVSASTTGLNEPSISNLNELNKRMGDEKIDKNKLMLAWKADELKSISNSTVVDQILAIFK